jgi:hypothetical protein
MPIVLTGAELTEDQRFRLSKILLGIHNQTNEAMFALAIGENEEFIYSVADLSKLVQRLIREIKQPPIEATVETD